MYKISVIGIGYVGLSLSVLLSQHNKVTAADILESRVDAVNNRISPISDPEIEMFLKTKTLDLCATTDCRKAYEGADFIIIATPTNYDPTMNHFDTSAVDSVIAEASAVNPDAVLIIKSTIPVGYTENAKKRFNTDNLIFHRNFSGKAKLYMIVYTRHAS